MTIITRTIAKGIPPRLHDPKPKGKPRAKKSNAKTIQGSRKRGTRESDSDSDREVDKTPTSDDSESARRVKKRDGKRRRVELSDSEVENVEDAEPPSEDVEEVDDGVGDEQLPDEQEVSPYHVRKLR